MFDSTLLNDPAPSASVRARVTPSDRLGFTLVAALLVHALIIFGIRFVQPQIHSAGTLEVTLVPSESTKAPLRADFLAQAQQTGSGTLLQARLLTSSERTPLPGAARGVAQTTALAAGADAGQQRQISSRTGEIKVHEQALKASATDSKREQLAQLDAQIAALQARLTQHDQAAAKAPRIRTLAAVSTQADEWAGYIENFRERVEEVGNASFPAQARAQNLQGQVRLLVALLPDGRIQRIQVLHSSGQRILDEAAQRSVRQAQPFGHFPLALRNQVDVLQIVRTWRFADTLATEP